VEFLRADDGHFYFMEMNTRLQVEHPVTEMVTGVDLVAQQFSISANRPLDRDSAAIGFDGHAVEFRINAEDPERDFRPDPGRIREFKPPSVELDGVTVRWDSAIREGYSIPPHYDSLIGKLIVHAGTRTAALEGARHALRAMRIEGVSTTIGLHLRLLEDARFCEGDYDTGYLTESGVVGAG
jgi:acetyl-CoA carboxylase biotin carboxylase subunit